MPKSGGDEIDRAEKVRDKTISPKSRGPKSSTVEEFLWFFTEIMAIFKYLQEIMKCIELFSLIKYLKLLGNQIPSDAHKHTI